MSRPTLATLRRAARPAAVADSPWGIIEVTAPDGHVMASTDLHWRDYHYEVGDRLDRRAAIAEAIADWRDGVEPCDGIDCEYCSE